MGRGSRRVAPVALALAFAATAMGCNAQEFPTSGPPGVPVLGVVNGSTLDVSLVINTKEVRTIKAGTSDSAILSGTLPPLPWTVQLKSPSGRVIIEMLVTEIDPGGTSGQEREEWLTCGTIKIWTGPRQPPGPPPPTDAMGNCSP